jgi:hypothetical protein
LIDSYKLFLHNINDSTRNDSRNGASPFAYFINARIQLLQIYTTIRYSGELDSDSILSELLKLREKIETDVLGLVSLSLLFEVNILIYSCESDVAIEAYVLEKASLNLFRAQGALEQLKIILFAASGTSNEVILR